MDRKEILDLYNKEIATGFSRGEAVERILPKVGPNWRLIKDAIPDYEEDDPRRSCQMNDLGIVIDPITLEEIPDDKLIHFEQNGRRWCFNIDTLAEYARKEKQENPVTRETLPDDVLILLAEHENKKMVQVEFCFSDSFVVSEEFHQGDDMYAILLYGLVLFATDKGIQIQKVLKKYALTIGLEPKLKQSMTLDFFPVSSLEPWVSLKYFQKFRELIPEDLDELRSSIDEKVLKVLSKLSLFESTLYMSRLHSTPHTLCIFPGFPGMLNHFKSVEDYFRPLIFMFPTRTEEYSFMTPENFISDYTHPFDLLDRENSERSQKLYPALTESLRFCFEFAIRCEDFSMAKRSSELIGPLGSINLTESVLSIMDVFGVEGCYEILLPFRPIKTKIRNVPEKFITYYCDLIGLPKSLGWIFRKGAEGPEVVDPVLQAKMIVVTGRRDLFEKYKETLDKDILLWEVSESCPPDVLEMLDEKDRSLLTLTTGFLTDSKKESITEVLKELLINPREINPEGFRFVHGILGKEYVKNYFKKALQIDDSRLLSGILTSVCIAGDNSMFSEDEAIEFVQTLSSMRLRSKHRALVFCFSFLRNVTQSFADKFYSIAGPKLSALCFWERLGVTKRDEFETHIMAPKIKKKMFKNMTKSTFLLFRKVSCTLDKSKVMKVYEETEDPRLLELLDKRSLISIPSRVVFGYVVENYSTRDGIRVKKGAFREFLRRSLEIQRLAVDYMDEMNLLPKNVNFVSKSGISMMMERYFQKITRGMEKDFSM